MHKSAAVFEIIHFVISQHDNTLSVADMCKTAGVSRSGYYAWMKASPIREMQEEHDRRDFDIILDVYKQRGYSKGAKGIYMGLLHQNPPVVMNLKKIRRLMYKYHLSCPIRKANPYRRMNKAMRTNNVAENLLNREFECYGPRMVLLTDITYIPYNGTFAYLSTILDAYTKQVLSYVLSDSLEVDFVLETVNNLVKQHGVSFNQETVIHSDQGCHYTSYRFIQIVQNKSLRQSMSRRGNCWDNAPQESFFGHMKDHIKERLALCNTYEQVSAVVDDYIDYYNNERYQWELAKLSPNEFYEFCITGEYPLDIPNPPELPMVEKKPEELGKSSKEENNSIGAGTESRDSTLATGTGAGQPLTQ